MVGFITLVSGCDSSESTVLAPQTTLPMDSPLTQPMTSTVIGPADSSQQLAPSGGNYEGNEKLTENPETISHGPVGSFIRCGQATSGTSHIVIYAPKNLSCAEPLRIAQLYLPYVGDDLKHYYDYWQCGPITMQNVQNLQSIPGVIGQCNYEKHLVLLRQE